ncbi:MULTISPECIES: S1 domain-containing RNA-binding protein [Brochothrix]|uniref:Putative RNA degradation protein n=1 Tax=Brochothrix thermosphacta TaxID=2756 RepID=A0A1D2JZ21_BROTH|nr:MULTISPECIES: S1 domain-containing RNA-binding protein [Brochothrix]SLM93582.1 RNA binding protein, contains ribosomal protein S1 domain [Brachybacterium faecium]ANZ95086.1 RNA-binding protein S1 [Brochothrix thermosphacta]ANZ96610.1 RNA-binding protein S1 [Brochothrix thermosphacta]ATF26028.1 RNA-binding protein S1 [Brochothrix thermosphacta]ATH85368.1 RNA-binding protein S1 [Brochothrix thermosphacta]
MSIEVGTKVTGKVTGITNFGAFVELEGGKTGLVHISEVADSYVKDIHDILTVGDEVTVKVMNVGDDGKIGLSIRRAIDKPESEKTTTTSSYSSRKPRAAVKKPTFDKPEDFESKMSRFLKDSDERLTTIKRQSESKRGGRGARRS